MNDRVSMRDQPKSIRGGLYHNSECTSDDDAGESHRVSNLRAKRTAYVPKSSTKVESNPWPRQQ